MRGGWSVLPSLRYGTGFLYRGRLPNHINTHNTGSRREIQCAPDHLFCLAQPFVWTPTTTYTRGQAAGPRVLLPSIMSTADGKTSHSARHQGVVAVAVVLSVLIVGAVIVVVLYGLSVLSPPPALGTPNPASFTVLADDYGFSRGMTAAVGAEVVVLMVAATCRERTFAWEVSTALGCAPASACVPVIITPASQTTPAWAFGLAADLDAHDWLQLHLVALLGGTAHLAESRARTGAPSKVLLVLPGALACTTPAAVVDALLAVGTRGSTGAAGVSLPRGVVTWDGVPAAAFQAALARSCSSGRLGAGAAVDMVMQVVAGLWPGNPGLPSPASVRSAMAAGREELNAVRAAFHAGELYAPWTLGGHEGGGTQPHPPVATMDIVVSLFAMPTKWVEDAVATLEAGGVRVRVWLYCKKSDRAPVWSPGAVPPSRGLVIRALPNHGREGHTFLHHILTTWETGDSPGGGFGDVVVFASDSAQYKFGDGFWRRAPHFPRVDFAGWARYKAFTLGSYASSAPANYAANPESALVPAATRPFGTWVTAVYGQPFADGHASNRQFTYSHHGVMSVRRATILGVPRAVYASLHAHLLGSSNPEAGHFVERCWYMMWQGAPVQGVPLQGHGAATASVPTRLWVMTSGGGGCGSKRLDSVAQWQAANPGWDVQWAHAMTTGTGAGPGASTCPPLLAAMEDALELLAVFGGVLVSDVHAVASFAAPLPATGGVTTWLAGGPGGRLPGGWPWPKVAATPQAPAVLVALQTLRAARRAVAQKGAAAAWATLRDGPVFPWDPHDLVGSTVAQVTDLPTVPFPASRAMQVTPKTPRRMWTGACAGPGGDPSTTGFPLPSGKTLWLETPFPQAADPPGWFLEGEPCGLDALWATWTAVNPGWTPVFVPRHFPLGMLLAKHGGVWAPLGSLCCMALDAWVDAACSTPAKAWMYHGKGTGEGLTAQVVVAAHPGSGLMSLLAEAQALGRPQQQAWASSWSAMASQVAPLRRYVGPDTVYAPPCDTDATDDGIKALMTYSAPLAVQAGMCPACLSEAASEPGAPLRPCRAAPSSASVVRRLLRLIPLHASSAARRLEASLHREKVTNGHIAGAKR